MSSLYRFVTVATVGATTMLVVAACRSTAAEQTLAQTPVGTPPSAAVDAATPQVHEQADTAPADAALRDVLGVREGATENAAACTALLADLRDRGLHTDRPVLVVIDGAKAVRNVFGERAIVQRCQAHKTRNVVDQLPDDMKPSVRQALRDAYAASDGDRARTMLTNLARRLCDKHPGAASSLEEGLDETLSVKRLRLPEEARAPAVDHECDREPHGLGPSTIASREALARRQDDPALDGHRGL